ncbi:MAG: ANTAR domain-containing protein [Actinomycetota bacterium]
MDTDLTRGLERIHNLLVAEEDLNSTLRVVAEVAVRGIAGCDCAGITLVEDDQVQSTACTDALCAEIDRDQYATGEGPCVDSIRTNTIMRLGKAATDERWPQFGPLAQRHGVESVLATPLEVQGRVLGALNLYGSKPEAFVDDDVDIATLLGAHAAVVLANVQAFEDSSRRSQDLAKALESRGIIERAKGILMEREKCSSDEAFQMLVRASQALNRKLRQVAEDVVEDAEGPDHSDEAGTGQL